MDSDHSVLLSELVEENDLAIIRTSSDYATAKIVSMAVGRPGLQLTGFYEYHDPDRILVLGKQESTYLLRLERETRRKSVEGLMQRRPCALILCHKIALIPEIVEFAEKYDVNVFASEMDTSEFMAQLISALHIHLAPRKTIHGVLVEVYGEGLLIKGDSGIGKSETALELIKRGHRLIADDAVEIRRTSKNKLVGEAPPMIRHYMELRGIGIVNARQIYGVGAVKSHQTIHLVINLEDWDKYKPYDRLGSGDECEEILGVNVAALTIPVSPGRNLAVILELAAMNNRQKKMGYNAAQDLEERHDYCIDNDMF